MFCTKCGKVNKDEAKFCIGCGTALSAPVREVVPPEMLHPAGMIAPPILEEPAAKKKRKAPIIIAAVAAVLVLAGGGCFLMRDKLASLFGSEKSEEPSALDAANQKAETLYKAAEDAAELVSEEGCRIEDGCYLVTDAYEKPDDVPDAGDVSVSEPYYFLYLLSEEYEELEELEGFGLLVEDEEIVSVIVEAESAIGAYPTPVVPEDAEDMKLDEEALEYAAGEREEENEEETEEEPVPETEAVTEVVTETPTEAPTEAPASDGYAWAIGDVTAAPGESVPVYVTVQEDAGCTGYLFQILVDGEKIGDSALVCDEIAAGDVDYNVDTYADFNMFVPYPEELMVAAAYDGAASNCFAVDGSPVVTMWFTVPADAASGTVYELTFNEDETAFTDCDNNPLQPALVAGSITVVDGNGGESAEIYIDEDRLEEKIMSCVVSGEGTPEEFADEQWQYITKIGIWGNEFCEINRASNFGWALDEISPVYNLDWLSQELGTLEQMTLAYCDLGTSTFPYLPNLTTLNIYECASFDETIYEALSEMEHLMDLCILMDELADDYLDINGIEALTSLEVLNLFGNGITDITPLSSLVNLRELYLSENEISDITPLLSLTNLEVLHITGNNISDEDIEMLKEALPNCEISY